MANAFNIELSKRETPADAQAPAMTALTEPARAVGLRLTKRSAGELGYKPRVQFPFLIVLYHNLSGEQITVRFESNAAGGTRVTLSGKVAGGSHAIAADPEQWSEALSASTAA